MATQGQKPDNRLYSALAIVTGNDLSTSTHRKEKVLWQHKSGEKRGPGHHHNW